MIVLDTETTGTNTSSDQIIEVCLLVDDVPRVWRVRPSIAIPPAATAIHGITDADVSGCPRFADVAREVTEVIAAADVVVGFNVRFDIDMLQAELARAGMSPIDLGGKHIVDVLRLWHHVEPRTLTAAHAKFAGAPLVGAHQAANDVAATARVLHGMRAQFGLDGKSWPELAAIADPFTGRANWIGPSHHIQWDAEGNAIFGFGKNQNRRVDQTDPGFLRWVIGKDFPPHVRDICAAALRLPGVHLMPWIAERYPRRPAPSTEAA
jgi:DNA polymerase-3 subunit epsilon